ncbi:HMG mobility box protein with ARID/BRIGHT DNA-binding domain-containing protein [Perilla frutescens var. hirtella]|nr:HMG mobility box protein with ARID/BRIGHT DNA-binding domain-containing protein [Perilla frutescens var. frutescens]KAH6799874.1 HMG mobility box protein with ARID/BRIGHT DNA-binding domain-containing protein [Perilla frutescens var. hirtella]
MSPEKPIPAADGADGAIHPVPLACHDDVVKDRTLFFNTLRSFHFSLGSKFLVPVIGGKELNLHVLYVEVTRRGGYDKVVEEKKWREISGVFDLSPTTTSASYALRKHYFTLLHRYEQVYFFRNQASMLNHTGSPSFQAVGTIDGKFDCGYLVSVKLGNETLNGVLYHPAGYPATAIPTCTTLIPYAPLLHQPGRRTRRRRSGDPGRPKPNRSGYNFFFAEKHSMLKSLYPNREREFTKMIGHSWNSLSPEERVVYQNHGLKDKERYQKELKEYKEKLKMGQPC